MITLFLSCKSTDKTNIIIDNRNTNIHKELKVKIDKNVTVAKFLEKLAENDNDFLLFPVIVNSKNLYINGILVKNYSDSLSIYHTKIGELHIGIEQDKEFVKLERLN